MAFKKITKEVPAQQAKHPQPVAYDWSASQATGLEHVKADDLGIAFLIILQKGSPEVDKAHPDHAIKRIIGAEVGDVINTLSRRIHHKSGGAPLIFIPCSYAKSYVEWTSRDDGGGFVKDHPDITILAQCTRNEKGQDELDSGNIIVTTARVGGFVVYPTDDGNSNPDPLGQADQVVIAFTSTQLKKARMWLNIAMAKKLNNKPLPFFSHYYHISTVAESNEKGSWYGWKVESGKMVEDRTTIGACGMLAKQSIGPATKELAAPTDDMKY